MVKELGVLENFSVVDMLISLYVLLDLQPMSVIRE